MGFFDMKIGFSTGTLALGDYKKGLSLLIKNNIKTVEISTLREEEFIDFLDVMDNLDLSYFEYVSFHAPGKLIKLSEKDLVKKLDKVKMKNWPIIVHPDIIQKYDYWKELGSFICIENMDKRKSNGKTVSELIEVFNNLPDAKFCFDIGHSRQVDPTMLESFSMLNDFNYRLQQIHLSHVNSESKHESLNYESIIAFKKIWNNIPCDMPIILETVIPEDKIKHEIHIVEEKILGLRLNE